MNNLFTILSWIAVSVVHCEETCSSSICINGGSCLNRANNVTCLCQSGYTGIHCETEVDDCALEPCHNGGSCYDVGSSYVCICPENYHGQTCSKEILDHNDCKELFITLAVLFSSLLCGLGAAIAYIAHLRGWKNFKSCFEAKATTSNDSKEHKDDTIGKTQEKAEQVMNATDVDAKVRKLGETNQAYEDVVINKAVSNQVEEGICTYTVLKRA